MDRVRTIAICLLLVSPTAHAATIPEDTLYNLDVGGLSRTYELHLPPNAAKLGALPVVVGFHGGGSNATQFAVQSQLEQAADRFGFALVLPNGTAPTGSAAYTWNTGLCCGYAARNNTDDVSFISDVLDDLPRHLSEDPSRVYATGMSNGGMMAFDVALALPKRFAAIGAVAATMDYETPQVLPSLAMPVIEINGAHDNNAPVKGGVGSNAIEKIPHRPVSNTISIWSHVDGYTAAAPQVNKTATYTHSEYPGRSVPFDYYLLNEGGHTWPGGVDITAGLGTGKLIASFDADSIQWQFFSQFARPQLAVSGGSLIPEPGIIAAVFEMGILLTAGSRRRARF